jgi:hypothetical protein
MTQTVSGKSVVGRPRGVRLCIARTTQLEHATPRQRKSAVSDPKPRSRLLTATKLMTRVVTRQKIFFSSGL